MLKSEKDLTILVVDDNPTNLAVLHNSLNSEGYKVRVEVDGYQALKQIELRPPDLILLDVMLPDIDGFQICRKLQESPNTKQIPIIFMTALSDTKDKVKGLNLGAVDYITKPFQQEEVLARVSMHLKLRHLTLSLADKNQKLEQLTTQLEEKVQERTIELSQSLDELHQTKQQLLIANSKLQEDIIEQKQIQETLKLQERAISASKNGIIIINASSDEFPIIFVNPAFEEITGYKFAEVKGQNCLKFWQESNNQEISSKIRSALENGTSCTVSLLNYRKDNSVFWNELSISPIYNDQGLLTHFIAIQTDISQRMKAERKLKQQLAAVEAAIDGIAILDNQARHIYANRSYLDMFGYDNSQQLVNKSLQGVYPPQEWERFKADIFPTLKKNGHWQGEATVRKENGALFIEEVSFTIIKSIGLVCVCRDITDRKQTEKNLRHSLKEKELLLKEIHHRVKNNLLVVSSLLDLQISYIEDNPEIVKTFEECQQRIYSMALIHEKLYQSKDLAKINFNEGYCSDVLCCFMTNLSFLS